MHLLFFYLLFKNTNFKVVLMFYVTGNIVEKVQENLGLREKWDFSGPISKFACVEKKTVQSEKI